MRFWIIFFAFLVSILIKLNAQLKPTNIYINVDNEITQYHTCFIKQDTAYIFGWKGYRKIPSSFPRAKYLLSKFYSNKIYSNYSRNIDSNFDQFSNFNVLYSKNKIYLLPGSNFNARRYFLTLDEYGQYISHRTDSANAVDGLIRMYFCRLRDGNFMGMGLKAYTQPQNSDYIYFKMDSTGNDVYTSPTRINNLPNVFRTIFINHRGNAVVLASLQNYRPEAHLSYSYTRFIELMDNGLPFKDTMNKSTKLIPIDAFSDTNGDYIIAGSRYDSITNRSLDPLTTPSVALMDSNATLKWQISIDRRNMPEGTFNKVKKLSDGNYLAVGKVFDSIKVDTNFNSRMNGILLKFDRLGRTIWKKEYRLKYISDISTITSLNDFSEYGNGDIIAVGEYSTGFEDSDPDTPSQRGWILKLNKNGEIINTNALIEETNSDNLFSIYPNPSSSFLNIDHAFNRKIEYNVYDLTGKKIETGFVDNYINVSHLPNGIYNLQLINKLVIELKKFEIQR
jgi:hypothetical protein